MGKSITQQARGKGSFTFQVRKRAYIYKIGYPKLVNEGKAQIVKLINSLAHSAPLAKIRMGKEDFYSPASEGVYEGQEIYIGKREDNKIVDGDILKLKYIPQGTKVFNIESSPGSGGKYEDCRATIGAASGDGRTMKPFVKAGTKHHLMLSKGRKWHRTSPIKTNSVDHPFGSGRGKRIKPKIAKRNAPPGAKVGHLRPNRTGHIRK
jgi:large subunit ribosomal protein L2